MFVSGDGFIALIIGVSMVITMFVTSKNKKQ